MDVRLKANKIAKTSLVQQREILRKGNEYLMYILTNVVYSKPHNTYFSTFWIIMMV